MENSLLRQIYALGHEMASVLESGEIDRYFELLEERGTLVEEITGYNHPSEIDPDWRELKAALKEQHQILTLAIEERERKMQEELAGMERYKGAARSYQRSDERPPILNDNLRV